MFLIQIQSILTVLAATLPLACVISSAHAGEDKYSQQMTYPLTDGAALPRMPTAAEKEWMHKNPQSIAKLANVQPQGTVVSSTEYQPSEAIIYGWSGSTSWKTILAQMAKQITTVGQADVIVVVANATDLAAMTSLFNTNNVNMSRVRTITGALNSIWMRDYGPRIQYESGVRVIVDSIYYSTRPLDNAIPTVLAAALNKPHYALNLLHSGGNYHMGESGVGYATRLAVDDNPSLSESQISALFQSYYGMFTRWQTQLPWSVDATGHVDMWFMPIDTNKIIISSWPANVGSAQALTCDAAAIDMQNRGFTVYRVPARLINGVHYTYVNSVICNNLVLIPSYTNTTVSQYNAQALAAWQAALPGKTVVAIPCQNIISAAGAMHCIVMHYPTHTGGNNPVVYVRSPNTAQQLSPTNAVSVQWISDHVRTITSVDIQLSLDEGVTFTTVAANEANDGAYTWIVPDEYSTSARIRVLARDALGNTGSDQSDVSFAINGMQQRNGDLDHDDFITISDLSLMLLEWGLCPNAADCPSDLDRDEETSGSDLGNLLLMLDESVE